MELKMTSAFKIIILSCAPLFLSNVSLAKAAESVSAIAAIITEDRQPLVFNGSCTNGVDDLKRTYSTQFQGVSADETIRVINKGPFGRNWKYSVSDLLKGDTKLPPMTITGGTRKSWNNKGLWVERTKTGERKQLNYLPGKMQCNTKGQLSAKFTNLWLSVEMAEGA